jgi:hypothetical protein
MEINFMENETVYKPIVKKFLGYDVRVVDVDQRNEYIICKDMFNVLGLVKDDGTWTNPKKKMLEFLELIHKIADHQELVVRLKDKQSKKGQAREIDCLNIETVPTVLTQFKPINSNRRTKEQNEQVLDKWAKFMEFVDMLLKYHECHKYIIDDKERYKITMKEIKDNGGKPPIANKMVNKIMGKLITDDDNFSISKDELKIYQPQTTIDLLEVRNFVMDKFATLYAFTNSHKESCNVTLKLAKKKYFNE